jgi:hypothetical protein
MDAAVAVSPILAREAQDIGRQGLFIFAWLGNIPDSVAGYAQRLADAPL